MGNLRIMRVLFLSKSLKKYRCFWDMLALSAKATLLRGYQPGFGYQQAFSLLRCFCSAFALSWSGRGKVHMLGLT